MKIKHFALSLVVMLTMVGTTFMTSCKDDTPAVPSSNQQTTAQVYADTLNAPKYTVVDSARNYTVEEMADLLYGAEGTNADEGDISADSLAELKAEFIKGCEEYKDSLANVYGENSLWMYFTRCKYDYSSTDEFGNDVTLSAYVQWASIWIPFKGTRPVKQNNILLVCPYTHTLMSECATSYNGGWEERFMWHSYLYIMPDGEGFGVSKDYDQPYLNHNLQANQIYDALVAGYELYTQDYEGKMENDWHLRVVGCSQGAGDAIAVHRLLDTGTAHNGQALNDYWHFEYSYVCCGPYNPRCTVEYYYQNGNCEYPVTIPLVIKSMRNANPDLANAFPEERFYSDAYLKNKAEWDKIYLDKTMNTTNINKKMARELGDGSLPLKLDAIFSKEALDTTSALYKQFIKCLDAQDLISGWKPKTKTYIIWSDVDVVVPPKNSFMLMSTFGDKCDVTQWSWSHPYSCIRFMMKKW